MQRKPADTYTPLYFLGALGAGGLAGGGMDLMGIIGQLASGGVGGGILTAILGKVMGGKA
mgnify:CR=1 FL=1